MRVGGGERVGRRLELGGGTCEFVGRGMEREVRDVLVYMFVTRSVRAVTGTAAGAKVIGA